MSELDARVDELFVYRDGKACAESEREDHACEGDSSRETGIMLDDSTVDLEPYQEKKEAQPNVANQAEEGLRLYGEYMLCEARYATCSNGSAISEIIGKREHTECSWPCYGIS